MLFSGFELKERLIRLRIKSELTTFNIAEYLGIEEEEVINIENGKSPLFASVVHELDVLQRYFLKENILVTSGLLFLTVHIHVLM